MKLFGRNIIKSIICTAIAAVQGIAFTACDSIIYNDLEPCPEGLRLRFVYDYNMEFANAFYSQVDCLTLHVYDKDGNYVATRTETARDLLSDENWRMTLDLPAGEYNLIAYGGMACTQSSFAYSTVPSTGTKMQDINVFLKPESITQPNGTKLHDLFYGNLNITIPEASDDYTEATVEMMKDTNNLRIVLQHLSGRPVNHEDFTYTLTADNTRLDHANDVVSTGITTYNPWATGNVLAGINGFDGSDVQAAYAEFSTSRFIHGAEPRLTICRASDGRQVVSIPLVNYLLMLKSQEFADMESQEFLDRESRWKMVFFLDEGNTWINTQIVINDWVVRINDTEL
ncbi:MAG: FimB/Mfa2 family fimbrial subunit [Duncaniella freteri]|nr:FimB/Mfa2 family fimbrial subunit [Duncaniella freteri]